MSMELRTAYWDDRDSREAFQRFILDIHNLDFNAWEEAGYWDDAYRPFSWFQDGEVISSVCIYSLPAVIDGRNTKMAQISGVGTLPEYRRCGLNRELTAAGLQWAGSEHEGVFLFSDEDAIPFYEHCGFSPMKEYLPILPVEPAPKRSGAIRVNTGDKEDLDRVYAYANSSIAVSERFTVGNPKLFMFHAMYTISHGIWEVPELECLVCFRREGETLRIYDILGQSIPTFEQLYPHIAEATDRQVEFHFHPDRLGLGDTGRRELIGNNLFVRPGFPVSDPVFPYTSRA